jgi:hypothetical protein
LVNLAIERESDVDHVIVPIRDFSSDYILATQILLFRLWLNDDMITAGQSMCMTQRRLLVTREVIIPHDLILKLRKIE